MSQSEVLRREYLDNLQKVKEDMSFKFEEIVKRIDATIQSIETMETQKQMDVALVSLTVQMSMIMEEEKHVS